MSTTVRALADAFADAVGEERSKIKVVDEQWQDAVRQACIVKIHATGWPAESGLSLQMLGIFPATDAERKAYESALKLGRLLLLPARVLKQGLKIRNAFRNHHAAHSIDTRWGPLIPQHKFVAWRDGAQALQAQYKAFAQHVYEHWDEYTDEVREDLRVIAAKNYATLVAIGKQPYVSVEEFTQAFVTNCMARRQTKEYWLASMKLWWDDPIFAPAASQAALAKEEAKNEMEAAVLAGLQTGLHDFVSDVRGQITSLVFNGCVDVLEVMQENGGALPRNSSKKLRNMIDAVEDLKFWSDAPLEQKLAKVRGMLEERATERDYNEMTAVLREIGSEARAVLFELDRPIQRQSRQVGIAEPDVEAFEFSRPQRTPLVFDDLVDEVTITRQARNLELEYA